jgi:sugar/nucleoside kinase (ribokinase family)
VTDVLVVGDANPDLILRGDVVPRFGQAEQLLSDADLVIGGSGAIAAHALARLGRSTRLAAAVGSDALGSWMEQALAAGGVDPSALVRSGSATGVTVVLSAPEDRAVLTHLGAIAELSIEHARAALEDAVRDGARHVHVASYFLLGPLASGLPGLLGAARSRGLTTSLDTNFDPAETWDGVSELLPHLDLLLPYRAEALALARETGDVEAAAVALATSGPRVVVKDGSGGAFSVDASGQVVREPGTPVEAVDTTGAGDTFDAAYIDGLLDGLEPQECLRRACLAGALSTSAVGGTAGQPTPEQLPSPRKAADVARQH